MMVGYRQEETLTESQKLLAGIIAGVTTRFVIQPLDVVKLRTQLTKKKRTPNLFKTGINVFKHEGIPAFWQGHNVAQLHSILSVTAQLYSYEWCTQHVVRANINESYKGPLIFLTGVLAGCVSATLVLPLDVMRVRQALIKDQYGSFTKCVKNIYKQGGIFAFFEGWTASILQIGPAAGINFCLFRWVQPRVLTWLESCGEETCPSQSPGNYADMPHQLLLASTVAGLISGFTSKTLTYPFDLAKRRLQISSHKVDKMYKTPRMTKKLLRCWSLLSCLQKALKHEGFPGLYRGWSITVIKAQVTSVMTFTTYELACHLIRDANYYFKHI